MHIFNTKLNIGFKLTITDYYSVFDERKIKGKYLISYSVRLGQIKAEPVYNLFSIGRWNSILFNNVWFTVTKFQIHYRNFCWRRVQTYNLGFRVCNNNKGFTWIFVAHVILGPVRIKSHWAFRKCQTSGLAWFLQRPERFGEILSCYCLLVSCLHERSYFCVIDKNSRKQGYLLFCIGQRKRVVRENTAKHPFTVVDMESSDLKKVKILLTTATKDDKNTDSKKPA